MIALPRVGVAELNERARDATRAAWRLGKEERVLRRAAFAAGDRVVAHRS
jgi:hypothetical protein